MSVIIWGQLLHLACQLLDSSWPWFVLTVLNPGLGVVKLLIPPWNEDLHPQFIAKALSISEHAFWQSLYLLFLEKKIFLDVIVVIIIVENLESNKSK